MASKENFSPATPYTKDDIPKGYDGINAYENGWNECLRRMRPLIKECRDAFAEELGGWDIELSHVRQGHDKCAAQLDAISEDKFP